MKVKNMIHIYSGNKSKKVGQHCECPSCGSKFIKSNYQQAFCKSKSKTKCKDKYWNTVDPKKRNNTTRISSASREWLRQKEERYSFYDDDQGWDAHKNAF